MSKDIGYEQYRFKEPVSTEFSCSICEKIVKNPVECIGCGLLYCQSCIQLFQSKSNTCTKKCPPISNQFQPIKGALLRYYKNLDILCQEPTCNKLIKISDIQEHEAKCFKEPCLNKQLCQQSVSDQEPLKQLQSCSIECFLTVKLLDSIDDQKLLRQKIEENLKIIQFYQQQNTQYIINQNVQNNQINVPIQIVQNNKQKQRWDPSRAGSGIVFSEDNTKVFLKESAYMFRTVIADTPMQNGVHYWEIHADGRTENELKIGVSNSQQLNFNSAFCDTPNGWAYYGLAQLRYNSNASGQSYGKRFKKEGILGCYLNMNTGILAFALNGEFMGIAFQNPLLTKGPFYAAVALLHCAGCQISSGKPVPAIFEKI